MGIRDKPIAPGSPWQNGFAERLIGSIRRECVDHVIALGEAHLRGILQAYARYYNDLRTRRSLDKDAPFSRRFSGPEASRHRRSSADCITNLSFRYTHRPEPGFPLRRSTSDLLSRIYRQHRPRRSCQQAGDQSYINASSDRRIPPIYGPKKLLDDK